MCSTCGCGSAQVRIGELPHTHDDAPKKMSQNRPHFTISGLPPCKRNIPTTPKPVC